jgi:prevent-host-death family protein
MKRVRIAQLKDHLSEHLRAVEHGVPIEVTDRNRPIARILPLDAGIERATFVAPRRPFAAADRQPGRPARWSRKSLELLLEERREG